MDLELKSDAATVFLEIAGQVRRVNRRRNETLYGVVRFSDHGIFLRWHNLLPVEGPTAEDPFQTGEALTNMLLFVLQTEEQAKAETEAHTRVRITNGITGETTIVESRRSRAECVLGPPATRTSGQRPKGRHAARRRRPVAWLCLNFMVVPLDYHHRGGSPDDRPCRPAPPG